MMIHSANRIAGTLAAVCLLLASARCIADSVDITLPGAVSFTIMDISQSTTGSPDPSAVSFTNYTPGTGTTLHISIQASTSDFTRPTPAGGAIPATSLSWSAGAPTSGGSTFSGSLSALSYTEVYRGGVASNSFNLTWTLAPLDPGVRAGTHTLTATWRIESL